MKILIINYRYFISGGPERYLFNLKALLELNGHEIIPFSIQYDKNIKSEYVNYFVTPLAGANEIKYKEQTWTIKSILKTIGRSFYSVEAYYKLNKLIQKTRPDVAIVLHYLKKLSPSILRSLKNNNIPFVVRLSDYAMVCSNAHLFRDNSICELCLKKSELYGIKYKCVQNSLVASTINYLGMKFNWYFGNFSLIKYYLVPSLFTMQKLLEAGWSTEKLFHLPTFVPQLEMKEQEKTNKLLYVGRIDVTKGVVVIIKAVKILKEKYKKEDFVVHVIGDGDDEYINKINCYIKNNKINNVRLLGKLNKDEIDKEYSGALISISPSLWYDNLPNSVLESMANAVPVIASEHGSFLELIQNEYNGMLFKPGDASDLAIKILYALEHKQKIKQYSQNALSFVKQKYSTQNHYEILIKYLKMAIKNN